MAHPIPQAIRDRFDQIEHDIMGNMLSPSSVFTKMRTAVQAYFSMKCDGNHGGGQCPDPECWNGGESVNNTESSVNHQKPAEKYDDTLIPFIAMMRKELHANAGKGDRPGWLAMSAGDCLLEIYYHTGKLQKAIKNGSGDGIGEYAADVANMAMMIADICGTLAFAPTTEQKCMMPPIGWTCSRSAGHDGPCAATPTSAG